MTDPADRSEATGELRLDGARVLGERPLGSLGEVVGLARPEGAPAEDWPGLQSGSGGAGRKLPGLERLVLRELAPQEGESEESVALLREDALALAGVEHPSILRVLGVVTWQGKECVALECPSGAELVPLLDDRELPPRRAVEAAQDIASALGELCSRGRPHRDFRSSSVFIPDEGPARIVPLACPEEFHVDERASAAGTYRGHPLYAAPELHPGGGREPTEKSNVFAFGVVLYEMLAYRRPFRGGTPTRLLLDVREALPPPPSSVARGASPRHSDSGRAGGFPAELDRVCLGCIEKRPDRRFPDFRTVGSNLSMASQTADFGHAAAPGQARDPGGAPQATDAAAPVEAIPPSPSGPAASGLAAAVAAKGDLAEPSPSSAPAAATDGPAASTPPPAPGPARRPPEEAVAVGTPPERYGLARGARALVLDMSRGQMIAVAGVAGAGLVVLVLAALLLALGEGSATSAKKLTTRVLADAEGLLDEEKPGEALRLLEEHPEIREVDPSAYDALHRSSYVAHWAASAARAEWEGRWDEAARALARALERADGTERPPLERRLGKTRYRASVARAEAAERSSDWKAAEKALVEAGDLAPAVDAPEDELAHLRETLAFAREMLAVEKARVTGGAPDDDAERAALFAAARLRPDDGGVLGRLAELGAGPEAARKLLARSREALEAGDLDAAGRHASDAAARWPVVSGVGERPAQVLTYIRDRKSCERDGMVLVTRDDPFVAWGPAERARAFGIDRYEYPNVAGRLPRRAVTWKEAGGLARRAGKRLCTLAEWQLACGGPDGLQYSYGKAYDMRAANTYGKGPAPSGSFKGDVSPFGVHDMSGNVAEWTADSRGKDALVAGGDWSSGAARSKSTSSFGFARGLSSPRIGFRCGRSLAPSRRRSRRFGGAGAPAAGGTPAGEE